MNKRTRQSQPAHQWVGDDAWKKGLPPDADEQFHRMMVESKIWDEDGNDIIDPDFWPDAMDLAAGRIKLRKSPAA